MTMAERALARLENAGNQLSQLSNCPSTFNDEFNNARTEILQVSRDYAGNLCPKAIDNLKEIKDFCSFLDHCTYEDALAQSESIVERVGHMRGAIAECNRRHKQVAVKYKRLHDEVDKVARACDLEAQTQKQKADGASSSSSHEKGWGIGLAFVPVVNLVATPILINKASKHKAEARKHSRYADEAVQAANATKNQMKETAEAFEYAFDHLCGQFEKLASCCDTMFVKGQKMQTSQKKSHWKVLQKEADRMQNVAGPCSSSLVSARRALRNL